MNTCQNERERKPVRSALLRMSLAFGAGLLLGALGNALAWNQLENPWPYLGLLCPLLLAMSVALIVGGRTRHFWHSTLGASSLAWIGFYLVFIVIAFQIHPYNPPQPDLSQSDQFCSPCFSDALGTGILMLAFFPIGPLFVVLIALAIRRALTLGSHHFATFSCWRRNKLKSGS